MGLNTVVDNTMQKKTFIQRCKLWVSGPILKQDDTPVVPGRYGSSPGEVQTN
jgi:hypothetical protein